MTVKKPSVTSVRITANLGNSLFMIRLSSQIIVERSSFVVLKKPVAFRNLMVKNELLFHYTSFPPGAVQKGFLKFTRFYRDSVEDLKKSVEEKPLFSIYYSPESITAKEFLVLVVNDLADVGEVSFHRADTR